MATAIQAPSPSRVSFEKDSERKEQARKNGRRRERLKLRLPVQVRPFDARFIDIEDVGQVMDFTRDGLYFITCMPHYLLGMRLIVTFPFGEKASAHHRFLGSVVRLEDRPDGTRGIAVRFIV
ncbi:MAG: hypothetical protein WB780_15370 [Candidatus Acidiferrales bacterium]